MREGFKKVIDQLDSMIEEAKKRVGPVKTASNVSEENLTDVLPRF